MTAICPQSTSHRLPGRQNRSPRRRGAAGRRRCRRTRDLVFGLATGRTPIALYEELARLTAARGLDWSKATTFNLDEFVGMQSGGSRLVPAVHGGTPVPPHQPRSASASTSWSAPPIRTRNAGATSGRSPQAGGIDIQILGIGTNGHIGFNEPGAGLEARTHRVTLTAGNAPQQRGAVRRGHRPGADRSAVDGDGDDSSGAQR